MTVEKDKEVTFGGTNGNLQLRGTNTEGTAADNYNYSHIKFTYADVHVACTGDIRTLLDYRNYKTVDTKDARFCNLFDGCVALTSVPDLPATTLASNCYYGMFYGCTNLDTAPALPAKTLADYCYYYMFRGCTNLKTAPELPATTLASGSYSYMFSGCTNLKTVSDVPAETLKDYCYCGMFFGCINLEVAPKLPAKTLADYCYYYMFSGCTYLTSVTMLAPSEQISSNCCYGWLDDNAGTSATARTLKVKDEAAYNALVDKSYLPNNWKKDAEGTTVLGENSNKIE